MNKPALDDDAKTAQLLYYLIKLLDGRLGRTRLVKLAYLSDLFSRMARGRPITNFGYRLDRHGPFDPTFFRVLERLQRNGIIQEVREPAWSGHCYNVLREAPTDALDGEERYIIEEVAREFGRLPLEVLLDEVVYKTEPARRAKEAAAVGALLDMDRCNNEIKESLGLDLATFITSKQEFTRGERKPLDELIDAL